MNRIYNLMRNEMDVEVLTGAHVLALIVVYGIQKLFIKEYEIEFLYIVEMFTITYIGTWCQHLLFLKKGNYSKQSNQVRTLLWFLIPISIESICVFLFGWYRNFPAYSPYILIAFIIFYYIAIWRFLHKFYHSETIELNGMLHQFQKNQKLEQINTNAIKKGENE